MNDLLSGPEAALAESVEISPFHAGGKPSRLKKSLPIPAGLTVLKDGQDKPPGASLFRVINQKDGDKRIAWDRMSLPEIRDAKKLFDGFVAEGLVPYRVDGKGRKTTEVMDEFDPSAEEILFVPIGAMVGG